MNYSVLRYTIGKILRIVSLLMILPLIIAFIYQEPLRNKIAFALTVVITYILVGYSVCADRKTTTTLPEKVSPSFVYLGFCCHFRRTAFLY